MKTHILQVEQNKELSLMQGDNRFASYVSVLQRRSNAWAVMEGSAEYPSISGIVRFYQIRSGALVAAE